MSVTHNTFTLERPYSATPERLFAAFADPARKRRWFVENGKNQVDRYELDFRVGGREVASIRHGAGPVAGLTFQADTVYLDIVPNSRIVFASTMAMAGSRISATLVTIELIPESAQTRLVLTHQGAFFEGADGPAIREQGWRTLLERLSDHATHAAA
jgi:uncharacterized protein YndB with AHSA1/START domain